MKLLSTLLLFFITSSLFAQTADNTESFNEKNIYYQSLTQYLKYLKISRDKTFDTIYIEDDFKITDSLLLQAGQTKFIKLNFDNLRQLLKEKQSFTLYRLFPLRYENGEFSVSFVPFIVTRGKNNNDINYANLGSYFIIFKFDNVKFHFVRIEDHGI